MPMGPKVRPSALRSIPRADLAAQLVLKRQDLGRLAFANIGS